MNKEHSKPCTLCNKRHKKFHSCRACRTFTIHIHAQLQFLRPTRLKYMSLILFSQIPALKQRYGLLSCSKWTRCELDNNMFWQVKIGNF